jgi:hypothetical protein
MDKEKKLQLRLREPDELNIKTAIRVLRSRNRSEALRKSLALVATLENFFQKDGSLRILDEEGDEKLLFFF